MPIVNGGTAGTWIDAHIHVDHYDEAEREALLEKAFSAGAAAVVAVSMHLQSSIANRGLAQTYPNRVHPAYGFHPEQPIPSSDDLDELFEWMRARHAAGEKFAIGEVGLPYYTRTEAEAAGQTFDEAPYLALLGRFAALAAELERPIVLHAVYEDADKACDILDRHGVRKAHFHWFKGSEATVRRMIASGYSISITPDIAYEAEIRALAEIYPLSLLMAETDGPWPFEGPYEGRATEPAMSRDVAVHIAAIKQQPVELVRTALLENTKRLYGL
ncbi:TatD family hydrolase [Paenibacillus harenae]|uniref:TatD DNase family protein n=1 Tax=Paenibacillus harenae TaxID=306543 RepID=A0ABT9U049_PAEHA|nr:TatD family hydrolase [Paenibacillus harenae]MDQ0113015.1 TatD DNase family protein [Paenibacillus harenae]